jgi:2'-5' RNA ligase
VTSGIMTVIRAFIAIGLPAEIQQKLEEVITDLKGRISDGPVRWVSGGSIHLTLKFLGDVSEANLEMLKKILQTEASVHHAFEISVGGLGAFPTIHRPRVIWVKVEVPQELKSVQRGIEHETTRLGYDREERPFSPHLTLGRVSRNATPRDIQRIGEALEQTTVGVLGTVRVEEVNLYRSDLRPGGAVYTCLFSAPLGA